MMDKLQAKLLSFLRNFLLALLPSFLRPSNNANAPGHNKSRLLVLEGLRGFACLVVFNYHLFKNLVGGPTSERATWYGHPAFFQWPWIYMFFNGRGMVFVFWVVSGYALAYKPVKLSYNGDPNGCNNALASSLIRRGFRLFLPPIAGVLITAFFCWLGIFEPARRVRHDPVLGNYLQLLEEVPPSSPNLLTQINDAFWASLNVMNILGGYSEQPGKYNDTYWVIPVQYRASLFVYLILLAHSKIKPPYRTLLPWTLTTLTFFCHRPDLVTHFGGLSLAALQVSSQTTTTTHTDNNNNNNNNDLNLPNTEETESFLQHRKTHIWITLLRQLQASVPSKLITYTLFFLGTLFLSIPGADYASQPLSHLLTTPLSFLMWNNNDGIGIIGALLAIHTLLHLPRLHILLTNSPMLYLGKISFSLYLVHGVVIRGWLYAVLPGIYAFVGMQGNLDRAGVTAAQVLGVYGLAVSLCLPVVVWVADLFYGVVEVGSERLGAWVHGVVVERM